MIGYNKHKKRLQLNENFLELSKNNKPIVVEVSFQAPHDGPPPAGPGGLQNEKPTGGGKSMINR